MKMLRLFRFRYVWSLLTLAVALLSFGLGGIFISNRGDESDGSATTWPTIIGSDKYEKTNVFLDQQLDQIYHDNKFKLDDEESASLVRKIWATLRPIEVSAEVKSLAAAEVTSEFEIRRLSVKIVAKTGVSLVLEAILLVPNSTPAPAVLALHCMGSSTDALMNNIDYHNGVGGALANAGFLTILPVRLATQYDERYTLAKKAMLLGTTLESIEIQQLQALVGYVERMPEFDGELGVYGLSLGGYHALLLGAVDQRIDAAYVSGAITDRFGLLLKRYPTPASPAGNRFTRVFWYGDFPLYFLNMGVLLDDLNLIAAVAPRPLAIETGERDLIKLSGLDQVERQARGIYRKSCSDRNLSILRHSGGHEANAQATVNWFKRILVHRNTDEPGCSLSISIEEKTE